MDFMTASFTITSREAAASRQNILDVHHLIHDRARLVALGAVGAAAAIERVGAAIPPEDRVVAGAAQQQVAAAAAGEAVVAVAAPQGVVAAVADQHVVAAAAVEAVGAAPADQAVVAAVAEESDGTVAVRIHLEAIGTWAADDGLTAGNADDTLHVMDTTQVDEPGRDELVQRQGIVAGA